MWLIAAFYESGNYDGVIQVAIVAALSRGEDTRAIPTPAVIAC